MYVSVHRIEFAGKAAFASGLVALFGAYVFTVIETFAFADAFNLLEHASLALAGVAFAVGVIQLALSEQRAEAGS
jgi:hypothetical protein